jgi:hypothetical protein
LYVAKVRWNMNGNVMFQKSILVTLDGSLLKNKCFVRDLINTLPGNSSVNMVQLAKGEEAVLHASWVTQRWVVFTWHVFPVMRVRSSAIQATEFVRFRGHESVLGKRQPREIRSWRSEQEVGLWRFNVWFEDYVCCSTVILGVCDSGRLSYT